jgi:hypothetical protein
LLEAAELEAALAGEAAAFAPTAISADTSMCNGQVGKYKVLIRLAARQPDDDGAAEKQGLEIVRNMGVQVDVQTDGELTCMTMIAPAALAQLGNNTTCTIVRAGRVVGVEVTAASAGELAAIETVRELVELAASRLQ